MAASILSALAIMWGIPVIAAIAGVTGAATLWVVFPLMVAWLLYFGVKSFMIGCPRCERSVFLRGLFLSVPWPARRCGKCGSDLTTT
jgi:hypothetical protein